MNRRGLILSVLALGVAGFGGATWFATRPGPVAADLCIPYRPVGLQITAPHADEITLISAAALLERELNLKPVSYTHLTLPTNREV
mgnify:CR=1 FL=1